MKTEYIAFSPFGAIALAISCYLFGHSLATWQAGAPHSVWLMPTIVAAMILVAVRSDAREPIANGTFERNWLGFWRARSDVVNKISPADKQEIA